MKSDEIKQGYTTVLKGRSQSYDHYPHARAFRLTMSVYEGKAVFVFRARLGPLW